MQEDDKVFFSLLLIIALGENNYELNFQDHFAAFCPTVWRDPWHARLYNFGMIIMVNGNAKIYD